MTDSGGTTQIQLLGGFRVLRGDDVLLDGGWNRRKALALLKLVAVQPAGQLHRDQAFEVLWPDFEPRAAANNLHKNLHYLRNAARLDLLALNGDVIRLAPHVRVDLHECLAAAEHALGSDDPATCVRALTLAKHELLPEDAYEDWAAPARATLAAVKARLLRELAALHIGARHWDAAIERTRELLELEPADEEAHRVLMQLYVQSGSRHRALRQFEICREALRTELGVEPSSRTVALHAKLLEVTSAQADGAALDPGEPPLPAPAQPPRLVTYGRDRELEVIESALDDAVAGRGTVLLLVGEAGIGKSHLLHHIEAAATDQDALALYGRAYEFDEHVPYQPVRGLLRQLVASPEASSAEPLLRRTLYLRRLLPGARVEPTPAVETTDLQAELFEEIWRVFAALALRRPLVLLFDDLHDADEGSLRFVHFLARRAHEAPLLVVVAARPERIAGRDAIGALRAALRRDRVARDIELQSLEAPALRLVAQRAFDGASVDTDLLDDVVQRSQGNPLFARELASAFVDEGWARFERGRWRRRTGLRAPVPAAVRDLLERRLERLSGAAHDLVNAAAVASVASNFPLLQAVTGLERREALDALDECISALLLEETDDGYRFRHDLVRQAAYTSMTTARKEQLHRAFAEALLAGARSADPGIVSHHLLESDQPWRAVAHLVESGRRAESVFAHQQARETLEHAVQLVRDHGAAIDVAVGAQAFEALADVERRLGDIERSVPAFEEAAARFGQAGDDDAAMRARGKAVLGHIIRGDAGVAQQQIEQTLDALTEHSPQYVVARTYYLLAQLHWHSGQNHAALDAAKHALLAAQGSRDPLQQARAYEVLALACHSLGDWQQGIEFELQRQALGVAGFDVDEAFDAHL